MINNLRKKAITGVKWTSIGSITVSLSSIIRIIVLTRFLDKSDFGVFAIILMLLEIINIFMDLGLSSAILHKQRISTKEYSSLYWLNVVASIVIYSIIVLMTPFLANFYKLDQLNTLVPLVCFNIVIIAFGNQFKLIAQKFLQFKVIALINIGAGLIGTLVAIIFAIGGFGIYSLVFGTLSQGLFFTILYSLGIGRRHKISWFFSLKLVKPFVRIGIYQTGGQLLNTFNREIDILILGRFVTPDVLGVYSLSKQLVLRLISVINPVVTTVTAPVLSKLQNDLGLLKTNYLLIVKTLSVVNFPIFIGVSVLSGEILGLLYGDQYIEGRLILSVLSLYFLVRSLGNPVGGLVIATGKTNIEFKWNFITFFITPLLIWIIAPFGSLAVATVNLSLITIYFFISWRILINRLCTAGLIEYLVQFKNAFIGSFIMGGIILLLKIYLQDLNFNFLTIIITSTIVGIIVYVGYYLLFVKSEYYKLKEILSVTLKKSN